MAILPKKILRPLTFDGLEPEKPLAELPPMPVSPKVESRLDAAVTRQRSAKPSVESEADTTAPSASAPTVLVDVDKRLKTLASKIRGGQRKLVNTILDVGEALAEAQDLLASHANGSFTAWLRDNCQVSRKTAYGYIAAWNIFGACNSRLQQRFEVTALTTLAAESAPPQARADALKMAGDGERITGKLAKSLIQEYLPTIDKPKTTSIMLAGGAIVVRTKPGESAIAILEAALLELQQADRAAA